MQSKNLDFLGNIDLKISNMNYILYRLYDPGFNIRIGGFVQSSMFFVTKGTLTLVVDGKEYLLSSGELFCKDVWQPIEVRNDTKEKVAYFVVTFNFEDGYSFANYSLDKIFAPATPKQFEELFILLNNAYEKRDIAAKINQKAILYELFYKIIKFQFAAKNVDKNEIKIAKAVDYINQNINCKISLLELSEITNYSIPHLRRLFYKKFGLSPLNYIMQTKIEKAKEIISIEDLPISDVSVLCGFETPSYFIKQFKKQVGITPKEYKAKFFK